MKTQNKMKTDKYLPAEDKRAAEISLVDRLNIAKHRNAPTVFRALGLPTALIAEKITVTWINGAYWVGTQSQEYAGKLGATYADVENNLRAKSL